MTRCHLAQITMFALVTLFSRVATAEDAMPAKDGPPNVVASQPAMYPEGHKEGARVVLTVTLDADGKITAVDVAQSAGADFDTSAVEAVRHWTFTPAHRDGSAVPARIKIPFSFPAPAVAPPAPAATAPPTSAIPPSPPSPPTSSPAIVAVPQPPASQMPTAAAPSTDGAQRITVRRAEVPLDRGPSTFEVRTDQVSQTAQSSAGKLLESAPGLTRANEGGAGHADQVFLRGFDAEQGQAIEFTVNGVPINEVDNTDGHGYADTHFIIPEVVKSLRVVEGPFDPHQGDFAVAGSGEYQLGVVDRGLRIEEGVGSFGTTRTLGVWAPPGEHEGTFAAAQFENSAGYGVNRASTNGSAMAQYEGNLGDKGLWRVLGTAYATHFKSAGVVRADDVKAGKIDFFGTEDPSQGGDAQRYTLSFDLENPIAGGTIKQQAFLTFRTLRISENFTGFLLDTQDESQSIHPQRGDAIEQDYFAITPGARGSYKTSAELFGQQQSIEVGYFARYDHTVPQVQRLRFGTVIPYLLDESLNTDVINLAGYADLDLHPTSWLTLRGGARQEFFSYDVLNVCATNGNFLSAAGNQPLNVVCPFFDSSGPRLQTSRITATGLITEPKATVDVKLPAGFTLTGSAGVGAQSLDATVISVNENAPFATLLAGEGGLIYKDQFEPFGEQLAIEARAVGYYTHVDRDLIFDPQQGRLSASTGTTRRGAVASVHALGRWFNELASLTYAYATFDDDNSLVPYVPTVVARSDTSVVHGLGIDIKEHELVGSAGLGLNFVGVRALPFSQQAPPTFTVDASAGLRWGWLKYGVEVLNVLDARYAQSEFFYASDFKTRPYPTLTPVEHFTAAAPRTVLFTVELAFDQEATR